MQRKRPLLGPTERLLHAVGGCEAQVVEPGRGGWRVEQAVAEVVDDRGEVDLEVPRQMPGPKPEPLQSTPGDGDPIPLPAPKTRHVLVAHGDRGEQLLELTVVEALDRMTPVDEG